MLNDPSLFLQGYIYLASPYSAPARLPEQLRAQIHEQRYQLALEHCANALHSGIIYYSPIVHYHAMAAVYSLPTQHYFWEQVNKAHILASSGLHILNLPGANESKGVRSEETFATAARKSITWVTPVFSRLLEDHRDFYDAQLVTQF